LQNALKNQANSFGAAFYFLSVSAAPQIIHIQIANVGVSSAEAIFDRTNSQFRIR